MFCIWIAFFGECFYKKANYFDKFIINEVFFKKNETIKRVF